MGIIKVKANSAYDTIINSTWMLSHGESKTGGNKLIFGLLNDIPITTETITERKSPPIGINGFFLHKILVINKIIIDKNSNVS